MMLFPLLVNLVFVLAITAVMLKTFGYEFIAAVSYLSFVDPSQLVGAAAAGAPVFFTGLAAGNDFLAALFILTFIAWAWPLIVCFMIMPVRCAFAWSLDQVFPSGLTRVSPRFHTPVLLTCIVAGLAAVVAVVATYTADHRHGRGRDPLHPRLGGRICALPQRVRHDHVARPDVRLDRGRRRRRVLRDARHQAARWTADRTRVQGDPA